MNIYLAGGAVRDLLLGKPIADRDYLVTHTTRQQFLKAFPKAEEVGRAFPVFLLHKSEFSFPRGKTIEEELESRDLTVNALLLDTHGELLCHPNSLEDIGNRVLRPASFQSFVDDPLRVFRAARFWAKYPEFTPHASLIETMQAIADMGLLEKIAAERIGQETIKALSTQSPGNYLRLLSKGGCLGPWFEECIPGVDMPAGPPQYHDSSVMEHTCRIMDNLAGDTIAVWMGLCHDLGKNFTAREHLPKHHGHDKRGITPAKELAERIRLSNRYVTAGTKAARWHMIGGQYDQLRPGTKVDILIDAHFARLLSPLFKLIKADQGKDFMQQAHDDLATILPVQLPPKSRNLGPQSGKILRMLRAEQLAKTTKKTTPV